MEETAPYEVRPKRTCARCGGDHTSPYACPQVSEAQKRQWRARGGRNKVNAPTKSRSPNFRTREAALKWLEGLAADLAKLGNTTSRATTLLAISKEIIRLRQDGWDTGETDLLQQATRIVQEAKARG